MRPDARSVWRLALQTTVHAIRVVSDYFTGGGQYCRTRAIRSRQANHSCAGETSVEITEMLTVRTTKRVDGLVRVADNRQPRPINCVGNALRGVPRCRTRNGTEAVPYRYFICAQTAFAF